PDTGRDAYRLVVELRQDELVRGSPSGELAVSFAGSRFLTEEGLQFFFARVNFADLGTGATLFGDQAGQPSSCFQLGFFLLRTTRSGLDRTSSYGGPHLFYRPAPADPPPGPWRRIEVEVRPDMWRVKHWEGKVLRLAPGVEGPRAFAHFQRRYPDILRG